MSRNSLAASSGRMLSKSRVTRRGTVSPAGTTRGLGLISTAAHPQFGISLTIAKSFLVRFSTGNVQ
jgi:hypothetical protein